MLGHGAPPVTCGLLQESAILALFYPLFPELSMENMTYLAVTGLPVGMLLNFGLPRLEAPRVLPPKRPEEWRRHVAPHLRRRWQAPDRANPTSQ